MMNKEQQRKELQGMSTDELGGYYSDFSKEIFGFRSRNIRMGDRDGLIEGIIGLHDYMDALKETVSGRNELRTQGWVIDEPTPEADGYVDPWEEMRAEDERVEALRRAEEEREASYDYPGVKYELEYLG